MSREQREQLDGQLRAGDGFGGETVRAARQGFAALMATIAVPTGVEMTETSLGGCRVLSVQVEGEREHHEATILYLHGGANYLGSPETALSTTVPLVLGTGYRALSLDYRLAPEHPFPANIEDVVAAYRELLESGTPAGSVAFAGDSAGASLAVTGTLAARQAGLPAPAALVLFSPGLDHTRSGASMHSRADLDPLFTPEALAHFSAIYLGDADPAQPLASPAVHADLTRFPPSLVQVGTNELLLDDSTRFAERARNHGADVILDVTAGVPHVFQCWAGRLEEADEALARAALFLRQRLG